KDRAMVQPYNTSFFSARRRAAAKIDFPLGFRWHDFRHTWATWHVKRGTSLPALKKLGGWKTLAMVERYADIDEEMLRENVSNAADFEQERRKLSTGPSAFGQIPVNPARPPLVVNGDNVI